MSAVAVRFERIRKAFPGIVALDDVSFGVQPGSVHALLGENGAGKSTLLKILSGAYRPDGGRLLLDERPTAFRGARDAIESGIAVIYQELQLVPQLSVAENLFLGRLPARSGVLSKGEMRLRAQELLEWVGEEIDPRRLVGSLPIAQRQMVEIAKALSKNAKVIAFDEPTSSLSRREVDRLFEVIRQLKEQGRAILYVSHRMDEIEAICDAATVLRDGKHVVTYATLAGVSREELVRSMVGRELAVATPEVRDGENGSVALGVHQLEGPGLRAPVSLEVRAREVVGLFGLVGAGRTELLKLLCGAVRATSGEVEVSGQAMQLRHPGQALQRGVAYAPEDRKGEGILPLASISDNINLGVRSRFSWLGAVRRPDRERAHTQKMVSQLGVRCRGIGQTIGTLSGGNQQKAILGRVLGHDIRVLLLDEPTRGIDIGAKQEIYEIVRGLAAEGAAILLVSSELPEVLAVSDRILVMREGRLVAELAREEATEESVLQWALPETVSA
jgi:L-arabinose transport system ATP-binding protein